MQEKICAIILTKNEEIHLGRVLKQISGLLDHILIVILVLLTTLLKLQKVIIVK